MATTHKFKIGAMVNFTPAANPFARRGRYKVVRLMPPEGDGNKYRVQCLADGHERVASESELD